MSTSKGWVCEGWAENTFTIYPNKSISSIEEPLHIHFDFNLYQPELMELTSNGCYTYKTMCPPGKVGFFFTIDKIATYAKDYPKEILNVPRIIHNVEQYDEIKSYKITKMNFVIVEQGIVLNDQYETQLKYGIPRPVLKKYVKPEIEKIRDPWKFEDSLFAKYIQDNDQLIKEGFEFDWAMVQKPKFETDEEEGIKQVLKQHYWTIKDIYKYQSSIGTSSLSTTFSIPLNFYTDYIRNAKVLEGKDIPTSESDTLFLAINKRSKQTPLNPGNSLIRFQFLEIIMRLGLKKNPSIKDSVERVKEFLENHIISSLKTGKSQDFRWNRYWNEAGDNLYKFHIKLLQEVYDKHSGALKKPGEESYMAPSEFEQIWLKSNLLNDKFANRDILVGFNLAMQTRVDEVNSDKHLKMNFIEFLEAVARAADYLSFPPPTQAVKDIYKKMCNTKDKEQDEVK